MLQRTSYFATPAYFCVKFTYSYLDRAVICISIRLQWHHNERNGISSHWQLDGLFNYLVKLTSKKTSKPASSRILDHDRCQAFVAIQFCTPLQVDANNQDPLLIICVNISLFDDVWRHQAVTWINVDWSSTVFNGNHIKNSWTESIMCSDNTIVESIPNLTENIH